MASKVASNRQRQRLSKQVGIYAGSFDPPTLGHMDVIERASELVDRLIVGVGTSAGKAPLFSPEERSELLTQLCRSQRNVVVSNFSGLTVDFAAQAGATVIIRGLRSAADYDYEMRMAQMNHALRPGLHTIFLPTRAELSHISSSLAKEIARYGGDSALLVPELVDKALRKKFK